MTREDRTERESGFVLSCRDYGESDRIVTFFTGGRGKLKGIAKGARRSTRRFSNSMELFCLSSFLFSRGRSGALYLIENCDVEEHFPGIRGNVEKTLTASYFIELVDLFTPEEKPSPALFEHLKLFLGLLEKGTLTESIMRLFELRILNLSGYGPALERCARCGKPLCDEEAPFFFAEEGGVRCQLCRPASGSGGIKLSPGTVRTLVAGKNLPPGKVPRLVFSPRILQESDEILSRVLRHVLGREPRSLGVLRDVLDMGGEKKGPS